MKDIEIILLTILFSVLIGSFVSISSLIGDLDNRILTLEKQTSDLQLNVGDNNKALHCIENQFRDNN
jgi:hypothetical protein